jgi:hypothetical protein
VLAANACPERTKYMKHTSLVLIALWSCLACEEKKEAPKEAPAPAPEVAKPPEPTPKPAEEPPAAAATDQAKADQAAVEANPLTACCQSLGKKGFMERSPEYMAASQVCGEALTGKKQLASVLPDIKKALKGQPLPDTCAP